MKATRMYTGDDGESHFEDIDIPLGRPGKPERLSELIKTKGIIFRETSGAYDLDFHNAPRRQFVINLEGSVKITWETVRAGFSAPAQSCWRRSPPAEDTSARQSTTSPENPFSSRWNKIQ